MTASRAGRALVVGAYERDNFGDLLFLLVTEKYLADAGLDVVATAPVAADMTDLLDRRVDGFVPRLEAERFDQVWTVGGEVGGTRVDTALWMSAPSATWRRYRAADAQEQARLRRELIGGTEIESPYLPRMSAFPRNATTPAVLNSIGLAGISGRDAGDREKILRIVREATSVSVRDRLSSDLLARHGIAHTLVPDVVHTVRLTHPRPDGEEGSGFALVQAATRMLAKEGVERFADALAASEALAPFPVRLFAAGLAPNHDSLADYARIVELVRAHDPQRDIAVLDTSRRPWELVDEIRRARLWVGGSLHGRIVAAAYDVPRVSFAKRKLDTYARTWDPHMPYGTTADTLDDAVRRALDPRVVRASAGVGERLAHLADRNVRAAVGAASTATDAETAARRAAAADRAVVERDRRAREEAAQLRRQVSALEAARPSAREVLRASVRARGLALVSDVRRVGGGVARRVRGARLAHH
ncbi:hypothetical protein GCM10009809_03300 [Isoptericola hypogeus]|uniref:Polysaccharide pyruvyl transferase domain-containing protein n=1 Tax=Isoptericola hypogeus TaxID=300179 RepID=A0ABN2IRJ0_9MICO